MVRRYLAPCWEIVLTPLMKCTRNMHGIAFRLIMIITTPKIRHNHCFCYHRVVFRNLKTPNFRAPLPNSRIGDQVRRSAQYLTLTGYLLINPVIHEELMMPTEEHFRLAIRLLRLFRVNVCHPTKCEARGEPSCRIVTTPCATRYASAPFFLPRITVTVAIAAQSVIAGLV